MPNKRVKYIHPVGLVGVAAFEPTYDQHPFTGMFQSGGQGIIRFSDLVVGIKGRFDMTPSFALKLLRDYIPSANMFAAVHGDGQKSWDFFACTMASSVEPT